MSLLLKQDLYDHNHYHNCPKSGSSVPLSLYACSVITIGLRDVERKLILLFCTWVRCLWEQRRKGSEDTWIESSLRSTESVLECVHIT
jgi:hypothetical protein